MKRARGSSSSSYDDSSASSSSGTAKRRIVSTKTVERWILEHNKILNTATWLEYGLSSSNRYQVATLRCKVCSKFVDRIRGCSNFNSAYIEGSSNLKTSY